VSKPLKGEDTKIAKISTYILHPERVLPVSYILNVFVKSTCGKQSIIKKLK
jgi:hypothetical protein